MKAVGLIALAALAVQPALAQPPGCPAQPIDRADKAFVDNLQDAQSALSVSDADRAISAATRAKPYARTPLQISALRQVEVAAHSATKNYAALIQILPAAMQDPCIPQEARDLYRKMLSQIEGGK